MKKRFLAGAALLASIFLFSACTSTPSISFSANWYRNTKSYGGLTGTSETLTYRVEFVPGTATGNFTAEYDEGTYTTTLRDVTVSASNPVEGVPNGFHGYLLQSEFSMTGRFFIRGEKGKDFTDSFTSKVWFLSTDESLRPVFSSKQVVSNIPLTGTGTPEESFAHYEYSYTAAYDEELTKAVITQQDLFTEGAEPRVFERKIGGSGTFLDNEQLLFAMRGINLSDSFTIRTINPSSKDVTSVVPTEAASFETYRATFSLKAGDGEAETKEREIEAARFSFHYSASNPGQAQTAIFARCTNPDENLYRSAMLSLEIDALYSLGTFHYTLASAVFNNK